VRAESLAPEVRKLLALAARLGQVVRPPPVGALVWVGGQALMLVQGARSEQEDAVMPAEFPRAQVARQSAVAALAAAVRAESMPAGWAQAAR